MTAGSKNKNPRGFSLWQAGLMYVLLEWSVCHPSSRLEPCLWRRDAPVSAFPRLVLQAALGWLCLCRPALRAWPGASESLQLLWPPPQGWRWGCRAPHCVMSGRSNASRCGDTVRCGKQLLRPRRASVTHAAALVPAQSWPGRRLLCRLRPRSRAGSAGPWAPAAAL